MIIFLCTLITKEKGDIIMKEQKKEQKKEKKQLKTSLETAILMFIIILLIAGMVAIATYYKNQDLAKIESKPNNTNTTDTKQAFKYALKSN